MSQEPQKPNISGPSGQVASRTPIRFGPAIEHLFRVELQGYTPSFTEVTSEYLLFGYYREARENQFLHVMVQGSRFAGKLVTEVGISRRKDFPYYKWSDEPKLAVAGYRERVTLLMSGQDFSVRYASQDELIKALRDLVVGQSAPALRALGEVAGSHIYREQQTWQPLYEDWAAAEATARGGGARRYPDLVNEEESVELLQEMLMSRKFDRLMGPMKFKYRDPRFFHCHMYLFARGLEFLDPPAPPEQPAPELVEEPEEAENGERKQRMLTWADILGPPPRKEEETKRKAEVPPPLGDAIAGINGRQPQSMCLELSLDPTMRHREFAFLKSLAAVEAFYEEIAP